MANLKKLNLLSPQTQTNPSDANQVFSPIQPSSPQQINSDGSSNIVKPPSISTDSEDEQNAGDQETIQSGIPGKKASSEASKQARLNALAALALNHKEKSKSNSHHSGNKTPKIDRLSVKGGHGEMGLKGIKQKKHHDGSSSSHSSTSRQSVKYANN